MWLEHRGPACILNNSKVCYCLAGEMVACSAGANFTPHIITVAAGEVWFALTSFQLSSINYYMPSVIKLVSHLSFLSLIFALSYLSCILDLFSLSYQSFLFPSIVYD